MSLPTGDDGSGAFIDQSIHVDVDTAEDNNNHNNTAAVATASAIHGLTTRHRGGFSLSLSPSSSFMPSIIFQIYIVQLYVYVLQFVKMGF